ncbi:MAG: nucleoside deaminase, partial [Clostridia bacterium]|nr:nucleoside deaminase [Clostridia bacterium]
EQASAIGEVPVGAVVVRGDTIISRGLNLRETLGDPTAHAEILALRGAALVLGGWRLPDTTIYVTVEPCPMCVGAIVAARVALLVYGARDPKGGAVESIVSLIDLPGLNHKVEVIGGVLEEESGALLKKFFQQLRTRRDG